MAITRICWLELLIVGLALVSFDGAAAGEDVRDVLIPNLPPHPRLLLTKQSIAEMKDRIRECDWAKLQWDSILKRADGALAKEIVLPPRGSNWFHWYACPTHGAPLSTGKQIGPWQWEHICSVGHEVLKSDPTQPSKDYDGYILSSIHGRWARDILDLGLVYQVTGDARYAAKAREILLAYADKYLTYPLHNIHGEPKLGGGHVGPQNLDESVWLITVCQGADLVWDALSESDRKTIADKMLLPAAKDVIMAGGMSIHNISCWRNSAGGLVGLLLDDRDLIKQAIYKPDSGFLTQLSKGVSPDGQWWEGAWGYHFYTISALWSLAEAGRNCGIDLYTPELKSMFDGPIKFAMPRMVLPSFHDSGEVNLKSEAPIYELAYARYKDPMCLELLSGSNRRNDFALWFGEKTLPPAQPREWKSANYPKSGYAVLAKGKGDQATWLCMDYGPQGGGHGHPDKLGFVLCARGQILAIDPGTARYGLPVQGGWYRTSIAHNTLSVDEASQAAAEGKSIAFGTDKGVDYAICDAGPIYDGVHFVRTAAMLNENLIVFVDQIDASAEHAFDIACHIAGKWSDFPKGAAWTPPDKPGYSYLRDTMIIPANDGIALKVSDDKGQNVAISLAGGSKAEAITATGVGKNIEDRVPVVIFRSKGKQATLVWAIALDGKPAKVERLNAPDEQAVAVRVRSADGHVWELAKGSYELRVRKG